MNYFIDEEKILRVNISDFQISTTILVILLILLKRKLALGKLIMLNDLETAVLSGISSYTRIASIDHLKKGKKYI